MMLGAILGDIIGSPFEFDQGEKTKDFELFTRGCQFTDDSVMTVAIAEALLSIPKESDEKKIKKKVIASMRKWGRKYPNAGYGGRFIHWIFAIKPQPYNSFGNGSAMRVSAAGWLYDSLDRTREVARYTAEVSHNHPEGIKGAEATASSIYLARNGYNKDYIKKYVEENFGYDLQRTLESIRPGFHHNESCQKTVPEAIIAFLESENFEDAIRNAVSLGGDTDTLAAITGSIAEAFYGIPDNLKQEAESRITKEMEEVVYCFKKDVFYIVNEDYLQKAIADFYIQRNNKALLEFVRIFSDYVNCNGELWFPFISKDGPLFTEEQVANAKAGDDLILNHNVRLQLDQVKDNNEKIWYYCYTSKGKENAMNVDVYMNQPAIKLLQIAGQDSNVGGIVINPNGLNIIVDQKIIKALLESYNAHHKVLN